LLIYRWFVKTLLLVLLYVNVFPCLFYYRRLRRDIQTGRCLVDAYVRFLNFDSIDYLTRLHHCVIAYLDHLRGFLVGHVAQLRARMIIPFHCGNGRAELFLDHDFVR